MVLAGNISVSENLCLHHRNNPLLYSNNNQDGIFVKNVLEGETLNYSLALLCGQVPTTCSYIKVLSDNKHQISEWPIIDKEFRILLELQRGINKFVLEAGGFKKKLNLKYEPRTTKLRVTPIYIICDGHDGHFQGPCSENRSPESAATRIGLGARLLQTLTAEKLHEAGHGRKTFQLERDLDGPECVVMHSVLHVDQARAMSQRELWELVGRELMTGPLASKNRKYMAFLSCTKYRGAPSPRTHEDILSRTQGHASLGGGGLALFGSACLHTWPTSISQIQYRFLDMTVIDTEYLMDDSNYRGTYGGCLATTLGSVLHELGHTFDLGHTRDGIMGRGFDYVDRVFLGTASIEINRNIIMRCKPQHTTITLTRPLSITVTIQQPDVANPTQSSLIPQISKPLSTNFDKLNFSTLQRLSTPTSPKLNQSLTEVIFNDKKTESQMDKTYWGSACATLLAYHRWFNSEFDSIQTKNCNDLKYDIKRNVVQSRFGVRIIELRESVGAMVIESRQFLGNHLTLETIVPVPPPYCISAVILFAEDSIGNILKYPLPTEFY
ncbi:PREDICTED: putative zinc metalloproteinase C607.06c [Ceratosolen solmsi marchali]|uniref:Zinc metalloproteinase C607.06c n=1 Tax=Ceratosolen solmsi marchali TaxID=326594 RepID=A0AAJ7DWV2_9HYME|nr:PREDICTED: putative zinc metalloproteinase C607.06c [Ceratosolen solmsi marchali]